MLLPPAVTMKYGPVVFCELVVLKFLFLLASVVDTPEVVSRDAQGGSLHVVMGHLLH